jgi:hypothetical protein
LSDQCNNPKWNYFVSRVERTNSLTGVGAEYLQIRKQDQQRYKVLQQVENQLCVIKTLPGERPAVTRIIRFDGNDEFTTIRDKVEIAFPLPAFLSGLFAARPRKAVLNNLMCLKTLLESGQVVLADGRMIRLDD